MPKRFIPRLDMQALYHSFNAPVTDFDCGEKCAPYNPTGKPSCCDICQAVPAAYRQEWDFLRQNTNLWQPWRGNECPSDQSDPGELRAQTPRHMVLLACLGPDRCQRDFRAISCRQFPFFPYVTSDYRFIGLAYEWAFESTCWVISNLWAVTQTYRQQFIRFYDSIFALWQEEFDGYAVLSEQMRAHFAARRRRIPILHRNGGDYLLSPSSESLRRVQPYQFRRFGPYT